MNQEFVEALGQLERERGIAKEVLVEAVEAALVSALKRDQKSAQNIRVQLDPTNGVIRVFNRRLVVEEVLDDHEEVDLEQAKKIDPHYQMGDFVEEEIQPKEFGRIAAQTAKQVVVQRIREAERSLIYDEFVNRVGDIVTGVVQRYEQRNVFIDLGKVEGTLPPSEQIPGERYEQGNRLKVLVVEVKRTPKGPQVITSRTRAGLLKRLFELEVPEIQEGLVEIKAVAREAGARSKIAVYSREPHVDPVGACVGARGNRVQMIVRELKGEKIDIIPWNPDWEMFISKAMSPARVAAVQLASGRKIALVVVPDHQLSLSIGKEGQNVRLAAKLTGWKIDIRSESQIAEMTEEELEAIIPFEEEYAEPEQKSADEDLEQVAVDQGLALVDDEVIAPEEPGATWEKQKGTAEEMPPTDEEEQEQEAPRRKVRKGGRTKQREIELEMESMDDTGLGFFSDVLGDGKEGEKAAGDEVAVPAEESAPDDSSIAKALSKAKDRVEVNREELSPIATALLKVNKDNNDTGAKENKSKKKEAAVPQAKTAAKIAVKATAKTGAKIGAKTAVKTTAKTGAKTAAKAGAKATGKTAKKEDPDA